MPFLATAFGTFLIRQVFLTMPRDLRDAAAIDGVGHLGFLRHVAVPLVRPTIAAMAALAFLATWNQYLWPNLITTDADMYTLQSGLKLARPARGIDRPNLVMAGVIIAFLPIVIVLLVFQRQLVRGLTAGGGEGMSRRGWRASLRGRVARVAGRVRHRRVDPRGRQRPAADVDRRRRPAPPRHGRAPARRCRRRRRAPPATTTTTPLARCRRARSTPSTASPRRSRSRSGTAMTSDLEQALTS